MISVVILAVMIDRVGISMRLVAAAAAVLLLVSPEVLIEAGFQMSFAAVVALVAVYEGLRNRTRTIGEGRSWLRFTLFWVGGIMLTSVVANAATGPFALYHFDRLAVYGVAANLVAVPVTAFWVMPLGLVSLVLMPLGLEALPLVAMGWGHRCYPWRRPRGCQLARGGVAPACTHGCWHAPGGGRRALADALAAALALRRCAGDADRVCQSNGDQRSGHPGLSARSIDGRPDDRPAASAFVGPARQFRRFHVGAARRWHGAGRLAPQRPARRRRPALRRAGMHLSAPGAACGAVEDPAGDCGGLPVRLPDRVAGIRPPPLRQYSWAFERPDQIPPGKVLQICPMVLQNSSLALSPFVQFHDRRLRQFLLIG